MIFIADKMIYKNIQLEILMFFYKIVNGLA